MLHPSMTELLEKVDNRYLLVNVAAKRAREIANAAAENGEKLEYKPVKIAVQQIYEEGIAPAAVAEEPAEAEAEEAVEAAE